MDQKRSNCKNFVRCNSVIICAGSKIARWALVDRLLVRALVASVSYARSHLLTQTNRTGSLPLRVKLHTVLGKQHDDGGA